MKKKIYYHDTDCGGVVYYANYLKYLEEARSEYLESRGISIKELWSRKIGFVVARQEVDYKYPARYGDELEVKTLAGGVSRASAEFTYEVYNQDGRLVITGKTVLVFVGDDLKPRSIPDDVRVKLGGACKKRPLG